MMPLPGANTAAAEGRDGSTAGLLREIARLRGA
jgi:hypothetical protein